MFQNLSQRWFNGEYSQFKLLGSDTTLFTDTLNLDYVLVVPSLDYNLLLVSQITTILLCIVIFWPDFCVFKDIRMRQMISCSVRRGKLYYLDLVSKSLDKLRHAVMMDGSEGGRRNMKSGYGIDIWGMPPLVT